MTRTVLIGLDGATFTLLDQLMEAGEMPFLQGMIARGVRARLLSTPNPLTPAAWTSLMTGVNPGVHGIFDFVRVLPGREFPQYTIATARDVQSEMIWTIASRQNRTVTSLNFPLMFPPRPVNGCIVPGFAPPRHLRRFVYPPGLYKRLRELGVLDENELLLNLDIERESIQILPKDAYENWILEHIRREEHWARLVRYLMKNHPADLTAVMFDGMDKLQHLCLRFIDRELFPANPSEWDRKIRELCLQYYRQVDGYLREITALAGDEAQIFIASDHGFHPTREVFYANTLLEQHGFLRWAEGVPVDREGKQMTEGHKSPVVLFDWKETGAYALTSGSNGVYIKIAGAPGETGVRPEEYEAFRARVSEALLSAVSPLTGERVVRNVLTREQAFPGSQMQRAPDLTLVLHDYGFLSILRSDEAVKPRPFPMGTHHPEGIFVAGGPGIRKPAELEPFPIWDIAPLLLYSLGLPVPENMEGRVQTEIFEPTFLKERPPQTGPATLPPDPFFDHEQAPALDAEGEAAVLDRLKALGYIE